MFKPIRLVMLSVGLVVLWLSSCVLARTPSTPTEVVPREQWITYWLEQPNCQLPCWENITPGTTTITETTGILSNVPGIEIGPERNNNRGGRAINWWVPYSNSGGGAGTEENGSTIAEMDFQFDYRQLVMLEEVINVYGSPDYIFIRNCGTGWKRFCTVHLLYDKGMVLELFLQSIDGKVEVSSNSRVELISFFLNGLQGYKEYFYFIGMNIPRDLIEWEGYAEYSDNTTP